MGYTLITLGLSAACCRVMGCADRQASTAASDMRRLVDDLRWWWTQDLFSCANRPAVSPRESDGLPSYPFPIPFNITALVDMASAGYRHCMVMLAFDTIDGVDPLTRSLSERAAFQRRPSVVHARWVSSSWWCSVPGVIAVLTVQEEHPRHNCRARSHSAVARADASA